MAKKMPVECWDRVVGYFRPKGETNPGKRAEIDERARYSKEAIKEKTENYKSVKR